MENSFAYTKLQLILELLSFLYARNYYVKNSDIIEHLGINERGVRRLIEQLRELGYNIDAKKGRDEGYKLLKGNLFLPMQLTEEYEQCFRDIQNLVKGNSNLPNYEKCVQLLEILASKTQVEVHETYNVFEGFSLLPEIRERVRNNHLLIQKAMENDACLLMDYQKADGAIEKGIEFEPYSFLIYKNAYYVVGYYHHDHSILRRLKLSRFLKIEILAKRFVKEKTGPDQKPFSEEVFEEINVKLKIKKHRLDLKEFIYGENQKIYDYDAKHYMIETDMFGEYVVLNFVLSLGADCEVISPLRLKNKVVTELKRALYYYEEN